MGTCPTDRLTASERRQRLAIAGNPQTSQKAALRVRIILGAAEGLANSELARQLGTSRPTVLLRRKRFPPEGVEGLLEDAPRRGRQEQISAGQVARILELTLNSRPRAATHWSRRRLAEHCGVSHVAVHRFWRAYGLQPHRVESLKLPTDPESVTQVRDIVGL